MLKATPTATQQPGGGPKALPLEFRPGTYLQLSLWEACGCSDKIEVFRARNKAGRPERPAAQHSKTLARGLVALGFKPGVERGIAAPGCPLSRLRCPPCSS